MRERQAPRHPDYQISDEELHLSNATRKMLEEHGITRSQLVHVLRTFGTLEPLYRQIGILNAPTSNRLAEVETALRRVLSERGEEIRPKDSGEDFLKSFHSPHTSTSSRRVSFKPIEFPKDIRVQKTFGPDYPFVAGEVLYQTSLEKTVYEIVRELQPVEMGVTAAHAKSILKQHEVPEYKRT